MRNKRVEEMYDDIQILQKALADAYDNIVSEQFIELLAKCDDDIEKMSYAGKLALLFVFFDKLIDGDGVALLSAVKHYLHKHNLDN